MIWNNDIEGIDLGHGVRIVFTTWRRHERAGLLEEHTAPAGHRCGGGILFDLEGVREAFPDRPVWTVQQWDPLTLSPSLLCECGHHGWIQNGKWVPA